MQYDILQYLSVYTIHTHDIHILMILTEAPCYTIAILVQLFDKIEIFRLYTLLYF